MSRNTHNSSRRITRSSWINSFVFCLTFVLPITAFAEETKILDVPIERIEEVVKLGFNMDPTAWNKVDAIIFDYPESPVGLLIQTYGHLWDHIYGKNDRSIEEWEKSALQSLSFAETFLSTHPENVDAEFILAVNELGLAKYYIHNRRWFKALFKTRSGWGRVKRILSHNPNHYDTAYAVGMMNCYFDNTPLFLKPFALLFGFRGNIDEGLLQLSAAAENGLLCRVDARYSLWEVHGWLLEDWDTSTEQIRKLTIEFPRNVFFQNRLAISEIKNGKASDAMNQLEHLLAMPEMEHYIGTQIHSLYTLASELNKLQENERVISCSDEILNLCQDTDEYSWYREQAHVFKEQAFSRLEQLENSKRLSKNQKRLVQSKQNSGSF